MNISIVIPNFNGEKLLRENLPFVLSAIEEYHRGSKEVIIADDRSEDNSIAVSQEILSKIVPKDISWKVVENKTQSQGFSSNVNRGVDHAGGDIVILLNTDVKPEKDFLEPLLKHFADQSVFAVGCVDKSIEDGKIILRGRGIGTFKNGFLVHSAGNIEKSSTLWVSGGSSAFRKDIWKTLGGFNVLYDPFYWEDIDLSYRAQKIGKKIIFEKKSIVVHEHSTGSIKSHYSPYDVKVIAYCNQFLFVWLNITDWNLVLKHLFYIPYHVLNALKGKDTAFLLGFLRATRKLPKALLYRRKMKKQFVKSDREILSQYIN